MSLAEEAILLARSGLTVAVVTAVLLLVSQGVLVATALRGNRG